MDWRLTENSSSPCFASTPCGVCIVARYLFHCWEVKIDDSGDTPGLVAGE
jgi:hypothetical protein